MQEDYTKSSYQGSWYKTINPNEHAYTPGYGFSSRPPAMVEQRLISSYSLGAASCIVGFFLLNSILPWLLMMTLSGGAVGRAFPMMQEFIIQAVSTFTSILALTLPFVVYAICIKIPRASMFPRRKVAPFLTVCAVMIAMGVSVVGTYSSAIATQVFSLGGVYFDSGSYAPPVDHVSFVLYAINMTLIPAIFEELAFRGIIMQSLRRFGDGFALLCSSMLFALVHLVPTRLPYSFLMGLVIGYFVLFTGSIRTGMVIHFVYNALVLLMVVLQGRGGLDSNFWMLAADFFYLVVGIAALVLLMRRYGGLFELRHADTVNDEGSKFRCFWGSPAMVALLLVTAIMAAGYVRPF